MIYLIQLFNLLDRDNQEQFIELFNDISYEIEMLGYNHFDDQCELVNDMLLSHFNIEIDNDNQLRVFTKYIQDNQGQLRNKIEVINMIRKGA